MCGTPIPGRILPACFGLLIIAGCAGDPAGPAPMPALRADGTRIVDDLGNEVILKGVNLGGWLFNETWITQIDYSLISRIHLLGLDETFADKIDEVLKLGDDEWVGEGYLVQFQAALAERIGAEAAQGFVDKVRPYTPTLYDDSDLQLRRKLSARFGDDVRDELLDVFQGAWLGESDIEWIAAQGFNVVRVPISYRNLVVGPDLDRPTSLVYNPRAWARIGRLLDWCEAHRIYAVLDIQECPGGQNDYTGTSLLYGDPALQALTVDLWKEIATRFGGRSAVAAYSLLAEPFSAPDAAARDAMYDRLVQAIRGLGDQHLLVIHDGFRGMHTLPKPSAFGWTNVVYSTHIFEFSAKTYEDYDFLVNYVHDPLFTEAQAEQNVPYYMGSFSTRFDEGWAYDAAQLLVDWYTRHRWSWSVWTYKRIDDPSVVRLFGKASSYGVRSILSGDFVRPDVFDDDLETLRTRMAGYSGVRLDPNPTLLGILQSGLQSAPP